jgi:hypothetical protein
MSASAPKVSTPLGRLTIAGSEHHTEGTSGRHVFHVTTPHALTQAAGYLKFIHGPNHRQVFFRGQAKLYASLAPTLVRGITGQKAQANRITALREACGDLEKRNKILDGVPFEAREPLFQHYGLNTSWIDLVDNVWVALWFSCHTARAAGPLKQYIHFEQRNPNADDSGFAYILLVATDSNPSDPFVPGFYRGDTTELIDLRVAVPSIFLRPHAQHGVLFRMRGDTVRRPVDYSSQISDIIRIDLRDALSWLGAGKMIDTHALFPPPFYDRGYAMLLDSGFVGNERVGTLHHIGT